MSDTQPKHDTDLAWEEWGRRDPYFGVLTAPRYRLREMTEEAKREFFVSGQLHVQYVLHIIRHYIDPNFAPGNVLDFGCGVGRTLLPFAALAAQVTGLDVSQGMLQEAQRNCDEQGKRNVRLFLSDDDLSQLTDEFDLIHSVIVFQHIPIERGKAIVPRLLTFLRPGGVGALHLTYAKTRFADTYGVAPLVIRLPESPVSVAQAAPPPAVLPDPEMQMNSYNLSEILFSVQRSGIQRFYADFTDHGGELGVFLFFQKPLDLLERPSN
jgi:SAM-dependent methyltransferase